MREVSDELSLAELAESAAASDPVPVPVRPMLNSVSVTSVAGVPTGAGDHQAPAEAVDVVAA